MHNTNSAQKPYKMKMSNIYHEILETMSPANYHHNGFVPICTWAHDVWLHIAGTYEPKECSTQTRTSKYIHIYEITKIVCPSIFLSPQVSCHISSSSPTSFNCFILWDLSSLKVFTGGLLP